MREAGASAGLNLFLRRITMARNTSLKLLVAGVLLSVLVGTPSLAPAKEEAINDGKAFRVHLINTLNLRPDKAKIFIKVDEKYDRIRQEALERINKSVAQLEKLLSNKQPDEGNMKALTTAIASDQDILVNTYKGRRDETMTILTPTQQSEYMLSTWKWQQKLLEQYKKDQNVQQNKEEKKKAP
jgi:hypothetical protein